MSKAHIAPVHPGFYLKEMLEELELSQYRLAQDLGVPAMRISHVVRGSALLPRSWLYDSVATLGRVRSIGSISRAATILTSRRMRLDAVWRGKCANVKLWHNTLSGYPAGESLVHFNLDRYLQGAMDATRQRSK